MTEPCKHEADFSIMQAAILELKESIKSISELLTSNAVLAEQSERLRKENAEIFRRLHTVELEAAKAKGSSKWTERVITILVTAALTGGFFIVKGG